MSLSIEDINLQNFLEKVTYTTDPNPGNKIVISNEAFMQTVALLRIDITLRGRNG